MKNTFNRNIFLGYKNVRINRRLSQWRVIPDICKISPIIRRIIIRLERPVMAITPNIAKSHKTRSTIPIPRRGEGKTPITQIKTERSKRSKNETGLRLIKKSARWRIENDGIDIIPANQNTTSKITIKVIIPFYFNTGTLYTSIP